MDYIYYCFKTKNISEKWNTAEIENFLQSSKSFPTEQKQGTFTSQNPFLSISLMNVSNYDSYSGKDYDFEKTNFISVVTSDDWYLGNNKNKQIQTILEGLEKLLNTRIQEER